MTLAREWTRNWWDNHRRRYRLVTGAPVREELAKGNHLRKAEKLGLMEGMEVLPVTETAVRVVEVYVANYGDCPQAKATSANCAKRTRIRTA